MGGVGKKTQREDDGGAWETNSREPGMQNTKVQNWSPQGKKKRFDESKEQEMTGWAGMEGWMEGRASSSRW